MRLCLVRNLAWDLSEAMVRELGSGTVSQMRRKLRVLLSLKSEIVGRHDGGGRSDHMMIGGVGSHFCEIKGG